MSNLYTTNKLIAAVKRIGSIPTAPQIMSDEDILALATDELQAMITPFIMSVREEYFVTYKDFTISAPTDGSLIEVEIPDEAIGQKLRDVVWTDPSNNTLSNIPRVSLEQVSGNQLDSLTMSGFLIQGNKILLYPNSIDSSGTLRLYYFARPLELTTTSLSGKVTAIDTETKQLTLDFIPSSWVVGDEVNVIGPKQPFQTVLNASEIEANAFPVLTLSSVENVSVGDFVALRGYSPIPQIPVEAHRVLAQATAVKVLESLGDAQGMQAAQNNLETKLQQLLKMLAPRVDGQPKKITTNGNGIFDWNRSRFKRNW